MHLEDVDAREAIGLEMAYELDREVAIAHTHFQHCTAGLYEAARNHVGDLVGTVCVKLGALDVATSKALRGDDLRHRGILAIPNLVFKGGEATARASFH